MRVILLTLVLLFVGCTSGPTYEYYEKVCDENGCSLEYRNAELPSDFQVIGQTAEGLPIIQQETHITVPTPLSREPIVPSELPPETFPSKEQWEKVINPGDTSSVGQVPRVEIHDDPTNPNNTLGFTPENVEIRGPIKTIYLERPEDYHLETTDDGKKAKRITLK